MKIRLEVNQEPCSEVEPLSLGESPVGFDQQTFNSKLTPQPTELICSKCQLTFEIILAYNASTNKIGITLWGMLLYTFLASDIKSI